MAVLPIVTYDDPILRKKADPVESDSAELQELINNMFETMYNANGVGLAAPQIGVSLRVFIVDADVMGDDKEEEDESYGPMVFINPEIHEVETSLIEMEEGCLSLPELREKVVRPDDIRVTFLDRHFQKKDLRFSKYMARVIQHEYDHINGVLFIDYVGSFRKRLMRSKLDQISAGELEAEYPIALK
ncbi:MAG: peptide deformylase [Balneolales bacterium]